MTENTKHTPDSEDIVPPIEMEGLDNLTGPAAFKAKQKAAEAEIPSVDATADGIVADLVEKVTKAETALAQANDSLLRTVAEMDNLRKRSVREREDASKYAVTGFAKDLLDVADTFRRALQAIPDDLKNDERIASLIQGIEATERSLLTCFEKNGIKKIEPMDEPFNPNFHEVMFEAPVAGKAGGIIIQLIEPGYVIHDRLLRPARVGVAKAGDNALHVVDTSA